ncbi:uncharacterized protein LOC111432632 isoform X2 [Cucurbita moschata]|uniref:Uncharacterized protein LOC111432632 isoform X2 n=1 Tax=Cucurbita moschata TaxID=3662 RepID=A0A6J1EBX0_CUCMO|nr:uncharacterized protein LOC111432632 isoform X2 [Cucurbita moschata]
MLFLEERGGIAATHRPAYGGARQDQRAMHGDRGLEKRIRRAQPGWPEFEPCELNRTGRWPAIAREVARGHARIVHPPKRVSRACKRDLSRKFQNFWNLFRQIVRAWEDTRQPTIGISRLSFVGRKSLWLQARHVVQ